MFTVTGHFFFLLGTPDDFECDIAVYARWADLLGFSPLSGFYREPSKEAKIPS